jgi:hypothetical protein
MTLDRRRAAVAEQERLAREAATRAEAEAATARDRARRMRLLKGFVITLLIGAVCAVGGWFAFKSIAMRTPGSITISSTPPGVEVWRDGRRLGITPFTEKSPARVLIAYTLKAMGYEDEVANVVLFPGQPLAVPVTLRRKGDDPARAFDTREPGQFIRLVATQGQVELKNADGWTPAVASMQLRVGDVLRTGEFSEALIAFPDGGLMRVNSNTVAGFATSGSKSEIFLRKGSTQFLRTGKGTRIQTPAAVGEISG